MTTHTRSSSWISCLTYLRTSDGHRFIAIFTRDGGALLYRGIPSHLPGLLAAGTARRSVGHAYHALLRGKGYEYQQIPKEKVGELRQMLATAVAS